MSVGTSNTDGAIPHRSSKYYDVILNSTKSTERGFLLG